ncbi:unnamed protein product [marine sediment metagenome]|uniref:Uncharacterized protein n=1 Tax=marine sediment metagenome TaxID=412755 RepID=X0Z9I5_9ZZZZ
MAKKIGKVQSKRSKKKANPEINIKRWVIITALTVVATMWLYGMTKIYFPTPVHLGGGQYFDLGMGIIVFGILLCAFLVSIMVNKLKKKNKI